MSDNLIQEIINQIKENHRKIIEEWCKAYLAMEYEQGNGIHPGDFTIIQQPVTEPNQAGYKYFLRKNSDEEIRIKHQNENDWIRVSANLPSDHENVWIYSDKIGVSTGYKTEDDEWFSNDKQTFCTVDFWKPMAVPELPKKD